VEKFGRLACMKKELSMVIIFDAMTSLQEIFDHYI
jgi:hypothetical protein